MDKVMETESNPVFDASQFNVDDMDWSSVDVDALSEQELDVLERKIAGPWGAVAWAFTNLAVWLSLWPLVFYGVMPIWLAFPIATLNIMLCYLPSHEAQHSIIAREGRPLRWLNEMVGHLSTIPMVVPYRVLKNTHMEHHAHANDPELDPDYNVHAESDWAFLKHSILRRQPGSENGNEYPETLQRIGKGHMILDALVFNFVFYTVLFVGAWSGYAIEVALLWWLPKHIAMTYISYYLSWAPHHPAKQTGRYKDTRGFKSKLGNLGSMGMQYHVIHHLYPRIPLTLTGPAYHALKPILRRRGVDLGEL